MKTIITYAEAEEATRKTKATPPASRFQVIYEDPAEGWQPTNLGIFESAAEARESAGHWLEGFAGSRGYRPRMAVQELKPQPLPEGAVLI
jgi:hypothetical protein